MMLRPLSCLMLVALGLAGGCRRPVGSPLPPPSQCRARPLGIGPRDILTVAVFNEQALTGEYRVGEDGAINFPYLGRIDVTGMQPSDLSEMLRRGLGARTADNPTGHDVLRDPTVRVEVREVNSRRFSVFGQVQRPGVFPHQQCLTLTQAISLAGGFTALAEKNQVRVTRRNPDGTRRTFVLRVEDIAEGRAPDFELEPDDVIFVPESIT